MLDRKYLGAFDSLHLQLPDQLRVPAQPVSQTDPGWEVPRLHTIHATLLQVESAAQSPDQREAGAGLVPGHHDWTAQDIPRRQRRHILWIE